MENKFKLCQGVSAEGTENLKSCYRKENDSLTGILSAEKIFSLAEGFIDIIKEPVFFFLELPDSENENENEVYYLDNCTAEVAHAIMKRYGTVLCEDGVSNFGFGSNSSSEEIYFREYQEFLIYCPQSETKVKKLFNRLDIGEDKNMKTMWDLFSDDNPGCLSLVEADGETVFDIPENLKSAGMYKAE